MNQTKSTLTEIRQSWQITGQVQGVGFRPFVYRLAQKRALTGFVRNDTRGVYIEAQGPVEKMADFYHDLQDQLPPLATVKSLQKKDIDTLPDELSFRIDVSDGRSDMQAQVMVDTALCSDCRSELLDPADRRYRYALITCTHCGPRYTIVRSVPYDRPNTTMAGFTMCRTCNEEYVDPLDRRFHAQPIGCSDCGPQLELIDNEGHLLAGDPITTTVEYLQNGNIVAIKGLGGFHLAVRADDESAVRRLRAKKHRDHKPLALMFVDIEQVRQLVELGEPAERLLQSALAPILLAPRVENAAIAPSVATANHRLGVMLPYTPIQHLIFDAWPKDETCPPLVMTSANQSDEPLVIDNEEALQRLGQGGLCDAILQHDRPIQRPLDDSVLIDMGGGDPLPIRRARGYVPATIDLPVKDFSPGLCVGGELKNTVAIVRDGAAILSQHLGDLTHPLAFDYFKQAIEDLEKLFEHQPQWIAHDLHPQYLSHTYAVQLAKERQIPLIPIQHHHAHAASVMAEHHYDQPVLAVVCDGTGYGSDGTIWGGELLWADLTNFKRLAHLRPLRLAGGDAAAKDTRRCGLALLHQALGEDFATHPKTLELFDQTEEHRLISEMIVRDVNCAASSGAGRYFDGVAALLGLSTTNHFEAQAAIGLEAAAFEIPVSTDKCFFDLVGSEPMIIDFSRLILKLLEDQKNKRPVEESAAFFHDQFALAWYHSVRRAVGETGIKTVALSGGVFCNQRLTETLNDLLEQEGLTVLRHRQAPANDGGLALGQAAIAAARMGKDKKH